MTADEEKYERGPLYQLPFGNGYVLHYMNGSQGENNWGYLQAAFVVEGRTYITIEIDGYLIAEDGLTALTEDVLVEDLVATLGAADQ